MLKAAWKKFDEFWLGGDVTFNLRVLQILWALTALYDILQNWVPCFESLLMPSGIFRGVTDPVYLHWWNIFSYADGDLALRSGIGILAVSLSFVVLRFRPKRAAILSIYLLSCFHHLLPHVALPQYSALRFIGVCLIFASFSTSKTWILRLIQFQFSIMYLCAALYKFQSVEWLSGESSLYVMQLNSVSPVLRDFVKDHVPWFFVFRLVSWSAVAAEVFCAYGLWFKRTSVAALIVGTLYTLAATLLFREPGFHLVMLTGLAAFVRWDEMLAPVRKLSIHTLPSRVFKRHSPATKKAG